jgi:steroid delta-isomerase-like uncharacterized protein
MSLEANKTLIRRQYEELINKKNLSVIDTDMTKDFIDHEAPSTQILGPEGVKQWIKYLHSTLPDLHVTIEDMIAEGDRVVVRDTWHGTHTGPFLNIPPTGKKFILKGIVIWRIEKGKIKERWATLDRWGLKEQLEGYR